LPARVIGETTSCDRRNIPNPLNFFDFRRKQNFAKYFKEIASGSARELLYTLTP